MHIHQERIVVPTKGPSLIDVTPQVEACVLKSAVTVGTCTVFCEHTSASLIIQENADPSVRRDLERWLSKLAPRGVDYEHDDEGPDDMPAHLRTAVTKTSETIPIASGRLGLGTWQAIYLWEHRDRPHTRQLSVTVMGK